MGFAGSNTPNNVSKLFGNNSSAEALELEQDPGRPMPIPRFVPSGMAAYTSNNNVYYAKGQYDPHSAGGIAVIGHEVVHAQQYSKNGNLRFKAKYLFSSAVAGISVTVGSRGSVMPRFDNDKAYYGNKYEKEADRREREIRDDLVKQFGGINPCP